MSWPKPSEFFDAPPSHNRPAVRPNPRLYPDLVTLSLCRFALGLVCVARRLAQPLQVSHVIRAALGQRNDVIAFAVLGDTSAGLAGVLVP